MRWADARDRLAQNQSALRSFSIANRWMPAWRYNPDLSSRDDAKEFLEAVKAVAQWVDANF